MATKDKIYLSPEAELELIKHYQSTKCTKTLQLIIDNHTDMICSMARKKCRYATIDYEDLVQEGTIGFIKGVDKYNVNSGNRLNTYARFFADNAMFEFIKDNCTLIKFNNNKNNNKVFFNLGKYRDSNGHLSESAINKMSVELDVPVKNIVDMHNHLSSVYFDYIAGDDSEEYSIADSYYEPSEFLGRMERHDIVENGFERAFSKFDDRMMDIIKERYLQEEPTKLTDLATKYGISHQRVKQLQDKGIEILKQEFSGKNYFS